MRRSWFRWGMDRITIIITTTIADPIAGRVE